MEVAGPLNQKGSQGAVPRAVGHENICWCYVPICAGLETAWAEGPPDHEPQDANNQPGLSESLVDTTMVLQKALTFLANVSISFNKS